MIFDKDADVDFVMQDFVLSMLGEETYMGGDTPLTDLVVSRIISSIHYGNNPTDGNILNNLTPAYCVSTAYNYLL